MHYFSVLTLPILAGVVAASPLLPSTDPVVGEPEPLGSECYYGTEFPGESEWIDYDSMLEVNKQEIMSHNSPEEFTAIDNAIRNAAAASGLDSRLILGVVMEECRGDAHIINGDNGRSPGMMQINQGPTCYGTAKGACPTDLIDSMINTGVFGTSTSWGLKKCLELYDNSPPQMLRCYNSGSVPDVLNFAVGLGNKAYVSDIGNRLRGMPPAMDCGF